jgi:antibiotic biosynthesis monooxygenase (ABM) superfamily enzyme
LDVRICRASAVIIQRVPAGQGDWFLEWQRGVTAAAESFAGYRGTDVYPPAENRVDVWVVVLHFDEDRALQQWLNSPARAEWVNNLRAKVGDFELKELPGGFGPWFVKQADAAKAPPDWKMVVTVLLGLYPTVIFLTLFPGPFTQPLGFAVSMLIGNALSVALLQWVVMPPLTYVLGPWLRANGPSQKTLSYMGLVGIMALLAILALVFRWARIGEP